MSEKWENAYYLTEIEDQITFAISTQPTKFAILTVDVVQLVRTSDCDSEGRGFESHHSPEINPYKGVFLCPSGMICP